MEIRRLTEQDARAYHRIRLRALREHPEAFGASVEEEHQLPLEQVAQQLGDTTGNTVTLGAWHDSQLLGIINVFRFARFKTRHKAMLGGMYVTPEVRGQGIGQALLAGTLMHIRGMEGLEDVTLAVTVGNVAARQLYVAAGFVPYGVEPRYIKLGNEYFDIEWMMLHIRA